MQLVHYIFDNGYDIKVIIMISQQFEKFRLCSDGFSKGIYDAMVKILPPLVKNINA